MCQMDFETLEMEIKILDYLYLNTGLTNFKTYSEILRDLDIKEWYCLLSSLRKLVDRKEIVYYHVTGGFRLNPNLFHIFNKKST